MRLSLALSPALFVVVVNLIAVIPVMAKAMSAVSPALVRVMAPMESVPFAAVCRSCAVLAAAEGISTARSVPVQDCAGNL